MGKIRLRLEAREMRRKLKSLPYVCRGGFVKMEMLKRNTEQLQQLKTERLKSAVGGRKPLKH